MEEDNNIIYFNSDQHIYTNVAGIKYISATTIIGKYEHKFDNNKIQIARACAKIGQNRKHPKYLKYRGMTATAILKKWDKARDEGCDRGNKIHDKLEDSIKRSSGYYNIFKTKYDMSNNRVQLYTIDDIISNPDSGNLDLNYFIKCGIKDKYPKIFNIIEAFINDGWKVYSEVAVFNNQYMISGLIDILFVKGKDFVILDWKTNKDDIMFESGYWEKDNNDITTNYKLNDTTFKFPLQKLPYCVGYKYTLQLSLYTWLAIEHGLNHVDNILCHIRHENYDINHIDIKDNPEWLGKTRVDVLPIDYLQKDIKSMVNDYEKNRTNFQQSIF